MARNTGPYWHTSFLPPRFIRLRIQALWSSTLIPTFSYYGMHFRVRILRGQEPTLPNTEVSSMHPGQDLHILLTRTSFQIGKTDWGQPRKAAISSLPSFEKPQICHEQAKKGRGLKPMAPGNTALPWP